MAGTEVTTVDEAGEWWLDPWEVRRVVHLDGSSGTLITSIQIAPELAERIEDEPAISEGLRQQLLEESQDAIARDKPGAITNSVEYWIGGFRNDDFIRNRQPRRLDWQD